MTRAHGPKAAFAASPAESASSADMDAGCAMAEIIARSDLCDLQGRHVMVTAMTPALLDFVAAYGTATEDIEPDEDFEGDDPDDEDSQQPLTKETAYA